MVDWGSLTLFLYILMRMSGFVMLNPLFGRTNLPGVYKAGFAMLLAVVVASAYQGEQVPVPNTIIEFSVRAFLELSIGFLLAVIMHFFFYIPEQAGEVIDTQMGMSMASTYDSSTQSQRTTTANLLNLMMLLLFLVANGHQTLLRIMLTSGDLVPFGQAAFGEAVANKAVTLFAECALLSVKLCLPILAMELMGQVGMGILMKVIPQINVFAINIELKVLIGLVMLLLMISPFSEFLLGVESLMLNELEAALSLAVSAG